MNQAPRDNEPEIIFPPMIQQWCFVRGLGDAETVEEDTRNIIRKYHGEDRSITAERFGRDKVTLCGMVQGGCLCVDVRIDGCEYVVLAVSEK
jgi:hypothetical protein